MGASDMLESISGIQKDGLPEYRAISYQHFSTSARRKSSARDRAISGAMSKGPDFCGKPLMSESQAD
jgi:hypothetical protein